MKNRNKKGIFFSMDAIISLTIILLTILVVFPIIQYSQKENLIQSDILKVLSSLKIGELAATNPSGVGYIQGLIDNGNITDVNKSVLDQIGEFYIIEENVARQIATFVISSVDVSENIGIWYGNDLLASRNSTSFESANEVDVKKQQISGIRNASEVGGAATAFSSRAFLTSDFRTKYFYFGGYIGDGNLSVNVKYEGNLTDMSFEIAINDAFDLWINGEHSGHYDASPSDSTPAPYDPSVEDKFHEGSNIIEFVGDDLSITGGYVKLIYKNSVQYEQPLKYNFPGVNGIINIYDSFFIPGILNEISIYLHYRSPANLFLNIGNITVFNESSAVETTKTITNTELISKGLNYDSLSGKTIPIRLGVEGISYVPINNAYIMSIADLSGGVSSARADGGNLEGVEAVQAANNILVDTLLDVNIVKFGLLGINQGAVSSQYSHYLSNDKTSLNNTIATWDNQGSLDLCAGIQNATQTLDSIAVEDDFKSMVLLGTQKPNGCTNGAGVGAVADTLTMACDAWTTYGIRVDTIGVIGNGDSELNNLLREIAECANGNYYNQSDGGDLLDLYSDLGEDLIDIIFYMQTASSASGFSSYLSPESYISFNYTSEEIPYGLITTIQTNDFGNTITDGSFFVPADAEIIEANVVSYSGSKWTDNVYVYNDSIGDWVNIFSLSSYGDNYLALGDPYVINLPLDYLKKGDNQVKITSGISPSNSSGSSPSNKAIYTIMRTASGYSDISAFANGCTWTIQFEDDTFLTTDIPTNYSDFGGTDTCSYTSAVGSVGEPSDGIDALQSAVWNLLELLDLNENYKLDVKFTEQDLQIDSSQITGIPYDYSIEVQVRKWS